MVGDPRFLVVPWVRVVTQIVSHLLDAITRRLRDDWQARYGYQPLLRRDLHRGWPSCLRLLPGCELRLASVAPKAVASSTAATPTHSPVKDISLREASHGIPRGNHTRDSDRLRP